MFIKTQKTPNPNALKFVTEVKVSPKIPVFFNNVNSARVSPIATRLYDIGGIEAVFLGSNFITVTKNTEMHWKSLKPKILIAIKDHFTLGLPIIEDLCSGNGNSKLTEIEKQIIDIIETRVRPSVAIDGGDIVYGGFKKGIVYLELHGACSGCPSSTITLKNGIQSLLQYYIPEVKAVESVKNLLSPYKKG